jgi:hypothetical protein
MRLRLIGPVVAVSLGLVLPSEAYAKRDKDNRVVPPKKKRKDRLAERAKRDFSEGGTRRGAIEFTLGSAAAVLFGVLIGRGAWEVVEGQKLDRGCADGTAMDLQCDFANPSRGHRVAAGLSFGFAVPMAIASGFLFAHGARVHRDYKAWQVEQQRVQLLPSASRRAAGLSLRVRF